MVSFILGALAGAVTLFLVLDNNPKLTAKLRIVKTIVKQKIEENKK